MNMQEAKSYLPLKQQPQHWQCPYCLAPVGIIGNWLAWFFGTNFHGCDFRNVKSPR